MLKVERGLKRFIVENCVLLNLPVYSVVNPEPFQIKPVDGIKFNSISIQVSPLMPPTDNLQYFSVMELNEDFSLLFYGSISALDYCNFQRSYLLCFFVSSPTNQSRKDPVPACQGKADGDPLYY